ncbi:MAG TPA: hypothetical protein VF069_15525 [Streptosporangiaceae bacterium]
MDTTGGRVASEITISGTQYAYSVSFDCVGSGHYLAYAVAGSDYFSATAGIADNASNADRVAADIVLSDQNGKPLASPFRVARHHPRQIERLPLRGAARVEIACDGHDERTAHPLRGFLVTLGDAKIEP